MYAILIFLSLPFLLLYFQGAEISSSPITYLSSLFLEKVFISTKLRHLIFTMASSDCFKRALLLKGGNTKMPVRASR